MSAPHILYSFRRCPYAMRARLALAVSGVLFEHREVVLRDKPTQMLAVSPKATVPVLITNNGTVIDESFDIMLWSLAQNDPHDWLGPDQTAITALIEIITGDFKHHLDRYKYASRYGAPSRGSVDLDHREKACALLMKFEIILSSQSYLMGAAPSLADYAIFPFIRQFSNVERAWWDTLEFPFLHAWLGGFLKSDLFLSIMTKHPQWRPE